jgi:hypothetical protein
LTDQGVTPAVITPHNQTVANNQAVPLTSIFSVSGTGITQYQVWFSHPEGGNPALGTVTNNGTPIALDQPVPITSLSGLSYTGSATQGTDIVFLRAYDGVWSGWIWAGLTDQGSSAQAATVPQLDFSVLPAAGDLAPAAPSGPPIPNLGLFNNYLASAFAPPAVHEAGGSLNAPAGDSSPTTLTQPLHR